MRARATWAWSSTPFLKRMAWQARVLAFVLATASWLQSLAKLKSNTDYGMFIPFQKAAAAAITGDQSCVVTTREAYEHRRNVLCDGLTSIGWPVDAVRLTMFVGRKFLRNLTIPRICHGACPPCGRYCDAGQRVRPVRAATMYVWRLFRTRIRSMRRLPLSGKRHLRAADYLLI